MTQIPVLHLTPANERSKKILMDAQIVLDQLADNRHLFDGIPVVSIIAGITIFAATQAKFNQMGRDDFLDECAQFFDCVDFANIQ